MSLKEALKLNILVTISIKKKTELINICRGLSYLTCIAKQWVPVTPKQTSVCLLSLLSSFGAWNHLFLSFLRSYLLSTVGENYNKLQLLSVV